MSDSQPPSAIYSGWVRHRRFTPVEHEFRYRLDLFFMDLDSLGELFSPLRFWSFNKRNLGQFRRKDFMGPVDRPLKELVLEKASAELDKGREHKVYLLANLRQWGTCFNPVSLYYVYENAQLRCIVAQVNNTPWDERHTYVIPAVAKKNKTQHKFAKAFHVSPFNPMDMTYDWSSTTPGKRLCVHMENHREGQCHMDATLVLTRKTWTETHLNRVLWRTPFNSAKVPLAIYWQALKLWWKGAPVYDHPGANSSNR
ncbi:DUF1365 domain-containing protein [Gilvimarinus xylanilyticus]|uniref:DUF1365 domain-containing protein n=1 Tax=Gilvimarinus xylanilyticus TaxID=2944139 RepID=A0A9X2HTX3_9GAMM|nr:DUF1365 domain-containing protein [Gilvimarinus xylanilyticus]